MDINFAVNNNNLMINNHSVDFPYPIRDVKKLGEKVIVLLAIPFNENTVDNLYAVSEYGEIVWQSQCLKDVYPEERLLPYEQMVISNQEIRAIDFYGRRYYINAANGKIIKRDITKL